MDSERSNKRARRSGVGEGEASSSQAGAAAAGGAGELSALEALHRDVLDVVLQQLGPAKASRVRLVSRTMREAVDRVVWRSLDLEVWTVEALERAAQSIKSQPRRLRSGLSREIKLAVSCELTLKLDIEFCRHPTKHVAKRWYRAVESLFSACSASSGGLGGVFVAIDRSHNAFSYRGYTADEMDRFISAVLRPLSAPQADGGSCNTLKSIRIEHTAGSLRDLPPPLVALVSSFPHLERLQLPHLLGATASAIPGALPALRSADLKLAGGAALAAFTAHPALEELKVRSPSNLGDSRAFEAFAAGPAARRLRRLDVCFDCGGFQGVELPSLSRLTSLETLRLFAYTDPEKLKLGPEVYEQVLGGMEKLRELDLEVGVYSPAQIRGLARAFAALRARSLKTLRLTLEIRKRIDGLEAGVDAALAIGELIRAAGPALIVVSVGQLIFYGDAFRALAACPRLRTLRLQPELSKQPLAPLAAVVDVLVACPRLETIDGLPIALRYDQVAVDMVGPLGREQEATEVVEPLRRLAAACSLGDGSGCSFDLHLSKAADIRPAAAAPGIAKGIAAVFPKARVRQLRY